MSDVIAEHRAAAELTRLDVDALGVHAVVLRRVLDAALDRDLDAAAAALGVLLSLLPYTHPLLAAARLGLEAGDARRANRHAHVQDSQAIAAMIPRGWATRRVPSADVQHRRYPPTGDRDLWVRYGPSGPPEQAGAA